MEAPLIYPDGRMMVVATPEEWEDVLDNLDDGKHGRDLLSGSKALFDLIVEHIL